MRNIFIAIAFALACFEAEAQSALLPLHRILQDSSYCEAEISNENTSMRELETCQGVYYCSDGGCIPQWFAVLADRAHERQLFNEISKLPVSRFSKCSDDEVVGPAANGSWSVPERRMLMPSNLERYCGLAISGFENDVVLWLREKSVVAYWARRFGEGAGSPPAFVTVSGRTFYELRGEGIGRLMSVVEDALEEIIGRPCKTDQNITCSVSLGNGRIVADVLAPATGVSGRAGVWEKSHWEVYPNQMFSDTFSITIDLPVTSIRRWPVSSTKPTTGFTSLDYDDGFEILRNHIAKRISERVDGQVEDWN